MEKKRLERKLQQAGRNLQPIQEKEEFLQSTVETAVVPYDPDDPKRRRNEELKRKALLIARKEESRKGGDSSKMSSSNGLSQLDAETLSNAGLSETGSMYSVASSDVMPFITGGKLPRKPIHTNSVTTFS